MTPRRCDFPDCDYLACLWNAQGEWSCGFHQAWLARPRDAQSVAA